jgi:hypothetical protein
MNWMLVNDRWMEEIGMRGRIGKVKEEKETGEYSIR